jgi:O-antigen/teichoic acid export membrane protein
MYVAGATALRILSASLGFAVGACFLCNCILLPYKRESVCLRASTISAILNISLNFIAIPLFSYNGAAMTTLVAEITVFLIYLRDAKKMCQFKLNKNVIYSAIIGCIAISVICIGCKRIFDRNIVIISVSVVGSMVVYLGALFAFKNEILLDTLTRLKKAAVGIKHRQI